MIETVSATYSNGTTTYTPVKIIPYPTTSCATELANTQNSDKSFLTQSATFVGLDVTSLRDYGACVFVAPVTEGTGTSNFTVIGIDTTGAITSYSFEVTNLTVCNNAKTTLSSAFSFLVPLNAFVNYYCN